MGNTLNYYRDMKETLLDQRKKRIGRNDFKRSMNAKRDTDRVSVLLLAAAIVFLFSSTLSSNEELHEESTTWKQECTRYFQFREPRIVYYREYAPTVWCSIESQKILKGEIPFDYKKDTR